MIRALSIATALAATLALPVFAEESNTKIEPGNGATSTMGTTAAQSTLMLNDADAQAWINKSVYSRDGTAIGVVVSFQRDYADTVIGLHADIGGFLGIGETRVSISRDQFSLNGDRVVLDLTAEQAKSLPKVAI